MSVTTTKDQRQETQGRFLEDVRHHVMTIQNDDGLFRVVRFARPGSSVYAFTVVTWPGYLAITGDMGDYVFSRVPDMFTFFRSTDEALRINPSYWHEKMVAEGRERAKEFSKDHILEYVRERLDAWIEEEGPTQEEIATVKSNIDLLIVSPLNSGEYGMEGSCRLLYEFPCSRSEGFQLDEPTDWPSFQEYTYHFLWCLYAIVWGIQQYDRNTEAGNANHGNQ